MYLHPRDIYPVTKGAEHMRRGARLGVLDVLLHYIHRSAGWAEVGPTCVLRRIKRGSFTTHRRFPLGLGISPFANTVLCGASERNRPPRADDAAENPRITMDCVASLVRGREFRTTHASTIRETNTLRTSCSRRGPCDITFHPIIPTPYPSW